MSLTITPFAQLPGEVLMDDRLKPTHIRVLIALYMHHNKKRDVIWPKRKTIARLTGIHEATISRLTTELEQFGWVTKEGNTGGCGRPAAYRVHVPDHITSAYDVQVNDDGDIVAPKTVSDSTTVVDSATVVDFKQNPSEIDYLTLAKSARGKEQTKNRQEQTNIKSAPKQAAPTIPGVPEELTSEWKQVRKAKRAGPISQTVIDALHREAGKAGITVEQAVRCCVERGWQGFKADWFLKDHGQPTGASNMPSKYAGAAAAIWGAPSAQKRGGVIDV